MISSTSTSVRLAALAGLALGIAACTSTTGPAGANYPDFSATPVAVVHLETHRDRLAIRVEAGGAVSALERQRIAAFVGRLGGDRPEAIHAAIEGAGSRAHFQAVIDALIEAGVEAGKITLAPGEPGTATSLGGAQVVTIAATRAVAVAPTCPGWPVMDAAPNDNHAHPNFGCSDVSNLAAMLADPSDLATGESAPTSDGERAATAVSDYRADKVKLLPSTSALQPLSQGGTK